MTDSDPEPTAAELNRLPQLEDVPDPPATGSVAADSLSSHDPNAKIRTVTPYTDLFDALHDAFAEMEEILTRANQSESLAGDSKGMSGGAPGSAGGGSPSSLPLTLDIPSSPGPTQCIIYKYVHCSLSLQCCSDTVYTLDPILN